jgi:hypothetical protein
VAEERMMYAKAIVFCTVLLLASCGDGGDTTDTPETSDPGGDHVWKSQTDMIDKARASRIRSWSSARQRQTIDELALGTAPRPRPACRALTWH